MAPAPASFHDEKVCVMDASGCLGSTLVQRLLQRGYTVHAAVQRHGDLKFDGIAAANEKEKLKIFHADPFDYQSIVDALKGCSGLFYAFEPPEDQPTYDLWEAVSKTLAEKTAWALAMDRGINMVSINGGLLMGPHLSIDNPYLKGAAEMYECGTFVTVDLNFLVDAHICVFEDVSSYGRYLCFNHVINRHEDALQLARLLTPSAPSPAHR
ncbi:hypothetical protein CCACVL1_15083 [Corchorus capsularis]|uniref:Uncharacterized protein n=1 Tax=Corchorus capsularis TaxID=210143 RepID=A0A1R3I405_COCAP|nr:hypothetical protein CCACVL1_15083 [Corchorus capsularis]